MNYFFNIIKNIIVPLLLIINFCDASAREEKDIRPGHVFQQVMMLEKKVNSLAMIMGVELISSELKEPINIFPRDVFYQGLTVHKKISRIRYEFSRIESKVPNIKDGEYAPQHVYSLIMSTQSILDDTLNELVHTYNFNESNQAVKSIFDIKVPTVDLSKQPKDVFIKLVDLNRKLNLLMDFEFSPADTFEQVTLAISYASAILKTISYEQTVYEPEPLMVGKRPVDVYHRLSKIHNQLFDCMKGVGVLTTNIPEEIYRSEVVNPSDVYDLANLILSNLAYLQRNLKLYVKPKPTYYPGKIIPSAVFQRVSILERQVNNIHRLRNKLEMKSQ